MPYVDAIIVNQQRRGRGQMLGLGDSGVTDTVLDSLTGGSYKDVRSQLDTLELALKVSIVASVLAGVAGLAVLFSGKR